MCVLRLIARHTQHVRVSDPSHALLLVAAAWLTLTEQITWNVVFPTTSDITAGPRSLASPQHLLGGKGVAVKERWWSETHGWSVRALTNVRSWAAQAPQWASLV